MDLRARKASFRKELIARRAALPASDRSRWSEQIRARVLELPEALAADAAFVFISHGAEVATYPLIDALAARGVELTVPRVVDSVRMVAAAFPGWDALTPGTMGIPAPLSSDPGPVPPEVVITPGLAFTATGDRLGYGRGYYDRWFREHPAPTRIAVAFECQLEKALPVHGGDEPVDFIVTEERVIRTGRRKSRGAR